MIEASRQPLTRLVPRPDPLLRPWVYTPPNTIVLTIISNISHLKVYNAYICVSAMTASMSHKRAELRNILGPYLNCVDV